MTETISTNRLTALMTVDPPATYGNGTHSEQLWNIKAPTANGGSIWVVRVGSEQPDADHPKGLTRSLSASNMKADAGAWPKAEAEEYLKEARKMWLMATLRRAE